MTNKKILKKQIIYRSTHRGSKEMDLLLGNFVRRNINLLTDSELKELDSLVKIEDEILIDWYFKNNNKLVPSNKITNMLKKFKF